VGALDRPLADLGLRRRFALSVPFLVPAVAAVAGSDLVLTLPRKLAKAVAAMANVRFVEPPPEIKSFQPGILPEPERPLLLIMPRARKARIRSWPKSLPPAERPSP
jgi:hypothetical protein